MILRESKEEDEERDTLMSKTPSGVKGTDSSSSSSVDQMGSKVAEAVANRREGDAAATTLLQEYKRLNLMVETALWVSPAFWGLFTYLRYVLRVATAWLLDAPNCAVLHRYMLPWLMARWCDFRPVSNHFCLRFAFYSLAYLLFN
jgi:hypothetical protein